MAIPQRFQIPKNEADFERMCLELLRRHWSLPGLELFGKRGEAQYGIDILDTSGSVPVFAAQCKLKEENKTLPPLEIQAEVDKAKQFIPLLGKYAILTTAKISTQAQRKVREINQEHKSLGLFEVELLAWDQLCALLHQYTEVQEQFYGQLGIERVVRIEAHLLSIKDGIQSLTSVSTGSDVDHKINEARDCITQGDFQVVMLLLNVIERNTPHLTDRQKYRIFANRAVAMLGLGKPAVAAKFFLEAAAYQPGDEQAMTNEVFAYLLAGDLSEAHSKATYLRQKHPASARLAALWITTAPRKVSLGEIEPAINAVLRSDSEVSLALAKRALLDLDFPTARKYADAARAFAPGWGQPLLTLAEICIGKAMRIDAAPPSLRENRETLMVDALEMCSRALELARSAGNLSAEIMALIHRVDVYLLLGGYESATKDAEDARRLNQDDATVLAALARARMISGKVEEGIALLARACDLDDRADFAFIYGKALYDRGRDGDLAAAEKVLEGISLEDLRPDFRLTVVNQVLQCLAKSEKSAEAALYLDRVSEFLAPTVTVIVPCISCLTT